VAGAVHGRAAGRRYRRDVGSFRPMCDDLETSRLRLRRSGVEDSQAVRELWLERDPRVPSQRRVDHLGRPSLEDMQQRITAELTESERSGLWLLAIEKKSAHGFIGYCGLTTGAATEAEPEIAFELSRAHQGQGFATEAAFAVLHAARATGRSRLWATVRGWNAASFNVLAKLGFLDSGRRTIDPVHGDTTWMSSNL
jgi:RimJ/RimL family protein N-acetyltransferase